MDFKGSETIKIHNGLPYEDKPAFAANLETIPVTIDGIDYFIVKTKDTYTKAQFAVKIRLAPELGEHRDIRIEVW